MSAVVEQQSGGVVGGNGRSLLRSARWHCLSPTPRLTWRGACTAIFLSASLFSGDLPAQTNNVPAKSANKYLFVVETSKAMQKRAQGVHDTLKALLDSNISGQLHPGDWLAIWSFNETVYTNRFPFQEWSAGARAAFGVRLPDFLESSAYDKRAALDRALARLNPLVTNGDLITIILITTGEEEIQGKSPHAAGDAAAGRPRPFRPMVGHPRAVAPRDTAADSGCCRAARCATREIE
jgi:hypothetical protein